MGGVERRTMNTKTLKLPFCRNWLNHLLHRKTKGETEKPKTKRQRHHGPTTFFDMP